MVSHPSIFSFSVLVYSSDALEYALLHFVPNLENGSTTTSGITAEITAAKSNAGCIRTNIHAAERIDAALVKKAG